MKIILLTPGLGAVRRGTERFCLELAAALRDAGLDAICWGTSEMPGVEALPVPGRIELQTLALNNLHKDARFAGVQASFFQDWANYAEDQLFAIPAALRIKQLLNSGERLLVYVRWQGGLIDPSGASTELLKLLANASAAGKAQLVVHTDYIYPPIDSQVYTAGAVLHSVGPWLTEPLLRMGIPEMQIVELPMCVTASAYKNCRAQRAETRRELGLPQDAFVILSVGSFDTTTPDKRHAHILREILSCRGRERIYWVVAGSRGPATDSGAWWDEAQRAMGSRFVPLTNVAFERMPALYGAADLFALASLDETFGLAYLEAQIAGVAVLIHEGIIQRHLGRDLAPDLAAISLVDMCRTGTAAAAIGRWMNVASDPHQREIARAQLDRFAEKQEQRFGWEHLGAQYANEFRRILKPGFGQSATRGRPHSLLTADEQLHRQGIRLFTEGKHADAARYIAQALGSHATGERWNDWAVAQSAIQEWDEAEEGFRRALEIDPNHVDAKLNLGVLLHLRKRFDEALPLLESVQSRVPGEQRAKTGLLIAECRRTASLEPKSRALPRPEVSGRRNSYDTACLEALFYRIPNATSGQRLLILASHEPIFAARLAKEKGYEVHCANAAANEKPHADRAADSRAAVFDPVREAWPYPDGCFDVIVGASWIEGLACDPMAALSELNRVLADGGALVLAVANILSAHSLRRCLSGASPYVSGQFLPGSREAIDHHNREYTPEEVATLAKAAGLEVAHLHTGDFRWRNSTGILASLAATGYRVALRGDTILLEARKKSGVRDRHPAALYDLRRTSQVLEQAPLEAREARDRLRVLVVHEQFPRFDRGGADLRLMQIVRALRKMEHDVAYLAVRGWDAHRYAKPLKDMGVRCYGDDAAAVRYDGIEIPQRWSLEDVLGDGQFDVAILFNWFWMCVSIPENYLDEIRRLSPETKIIVLTDDRHGHRESQRARLSGLFSDAERGRDFEEREREIYVAADLVVSITDEDRQEIRRLAPATLVELVPMAVQAAPFGGDFDSRSGLVFLGDYNNPANLEGLDWFLKRVWPRVREKIPGIKLHLLGSQMPKDLAGGYEDVECAGYVPELAPELAKYRVFVSPIRFGTGIKTKNLSALAYGLPLVTTRCGAEGMKLINQEHALVADSAAAFARAILCAYTDRALWQKIARKGREHILSEFSEGRLYEALARALDLVRCLPSKAHDPAHCFSIRLVEKHFPEVLTHWPAGERPSLRVLAYAKLADQLIASGEREEACRQIQHIFSFVPNRIPYEVFFTAFSNVIGSMEKSYRAAGKVDSAIGLRRQVDAASAVSPLPEDNSSPVGKPGKIKHNSAAIHVSVIIPTFNRCSTLQACLLALDRQTASRKQLEAIVIDDGSEDDTEAFCRVQKFSYPVRYFRQENRGAGAARRLGVEKSSGELLLLINDDTIADPALVAEHLRAHEEHAGEKIAVLGDFSYPPECQKRALTWFLSRSPILFPQVELRPGLHDKNAYFVSCNLSIPRSAVVATGSFDAAFRVAEDTELGIRLRAAGYRVLFEPRARALHDHLQFTIGDFINRARAYGRTQMLLFRKHPQLIGDGAGPFGRLTDADIESIQERVGRTRSEVLEAVQALEKFDSFDFTRFTDAKNGAGPSAEDIMQMFARAVPEVFWHFLFESFLEAWREEANPKTAMAAEMMEGRIA